MPASRVTPGKLPWPHVAVRLLASSAVLVTLNGLLAGPVQAQSPAFDEDAVRQTWQGTIRPILDRACVDCHSGQGAEGSLDLEQFESMDQVVRDRRLWRKIANRVRDRQMPPPESVELSAADRKRLLAWIDQSLPLVPCQHEHHAGPVTIRRLTRYEYANTIRDLLRVEYPFQDAFPADASGYGFDNIGDVLSVSPLLLEKYLMAAESISEMVIADVASKVYSGLFGPSDFGTVDGGYIDDSHMMLTTNSTITIELHPQLEGSYLIAVTAFGRRAGDELPELAVSANGKVIETVRVKQQRPDEAETFEFKTRLDAGRNTLQLTFTNDFYDPRHPDPRRRDRNLAVCHVKVDGPARLPKTSAAERAFLFVTPRSSRSPEECARRIIDLHASRAFRRRIYASERERLLELFKLGLDNGESFPGAMRLVLQAILVSPHFLYRVEAPVPDDASPRRLSDYELATAMSYFLWSSMPDDRLFRLATQGMLDGREIRMAEVRRMLQDQRAEALVDNFAAQWLQLRLLDTADPDPEQFPGFDEPLRHSMLQETRLLLREVLLNDQPLTSLLTANYTFVNQSLASHYGLPTRGLTEDEFSRVSLQGTRRQGLLSHASILTLTSNPTRTSPVKRGKWVLENLLGDPPPPALPEVPTLESQQELQGSLRERMVQHRADPNCAVCHYKMDSLGFALEHFDAFGRYREEDQGRPIDAAGQLPDGRQFQSAAELQALIAEQQRQPFYRCLVEKLFIYALGRGPSDGDDCLIDGIARQASAEDWRFSDLVLAIVNSEAFLSRSRGIATSNGEQHETQN
jgi:hypothetical protein